MAHASPTTEYLFDFIYLDRSRLNSFAAQLFDDGLMTGLKRTKQHSEGEDHEVGGGIPAVAAGKVVQREGVNEAVERQFDAAWVMPVNTINRLHESGYLATELAGALIGGLVLIKGRLRLLDIRTLQHLWQPMVDVLKRQLDEDAKPLKRTDPAARLALDRIDAQKTELKLVGEVLPKLPHALQITLSSDDGAAWSTLAPEHMTINPDDLALKHGANIAGEWFALAVLDAIPDQPGSTEYGSNGSMRGLEVGLAQMLSGLRDLYGRPPDTYGITPVAIFRPIRKRP